MHYILFKEQAHTYEEKHNWVLRQSLKRSSDCLRMHPLGPRTKLVGITTEH